MHSLHWVASKRQIRLGRDTLQCGRMHLAMRKGFLARCDAGDNSNGGGVHAVHNCPLPQWVHQGSLSQLCRF